MAELSEARRNYEALQATAQRAKETALRLKEGLTLLTLTLLTLALPPNPSPPNKEAALRLKEGLAPQHPSPTPSPNPNPIPNPNPKPKPNPNPNPKPNPNCSSNPNPNPNPKPNPSPNQEGLAREHQKAFKRNEAKGVSSGPEDVKAALDARLSALGQPKPAPKRGEVHEHT